MKFPELARRLRAEKNFDLQAYAIDAKDEQTRTKRLVRIGAIQNQMVLPTNAPLIEQVKYSSHHPHTLNIDIFFYFF